LPPEADGVSPPPENLKVLGDFLHQDPFRNSIRVLILISLGMNRHLGFTDLLELTEVSKGSLAHHLDQLAAAGFVSSRMVFTLMGPRIRVEITPTGIEAFENLTRALAHVTAQGSARPPDASPMAELSSR
jgi:DNA-binding HxlR family transcriptional regulator